MTIPSAHSHKSLADDLAKIELTSVEKLGDDLCGGLKVSSNVEIARSP
jgi:hypothetical protein